MTGISHLNHPHLVVLGVRTAGDGVERSIGLRHEGGNAGIDFPANDGSLLPDLMEAGESPTGAHPGASYVAAPGRFPVEPRAQIASGNARGRVPRPTANLVHWPGGACREPVA